MINNSFKKLHFGDIIVCINKEQNCDCITILKKYKVLHIEECYNEIYINNDFNIGIYIHHKYFATLKEYEIINRKEKLKKILK